METTQPVIDRLGVNVTYAKALITEYEGRLSVIEAQIAHIEEVKREDERVVRLNKEAIRKQLQTQIEDLRAQEVVEVDLLEIALQERRAPLNGQKNSILAEIDRVKISIAPVRYVPAEILGYIFREVVTLDVPPWLMTTVSKSWRRTALTNPWLWSNLHVGVLHYAGRGDERSRWIVNGASRLCYGSRLACRDLEELAYFTDKSGVVPLDVTLRYDHRGQEWEVLQPLLGPIYSSRISSLSISVGDESKVAASWDLGPFPLLQNLSCWSVEAPLIKLIMAKAYHVKSFAANRLSSDLPKYSFCKTLRELNFRGWDTVELNLVVAELKLIEVIQGCPRSWPNAQTPVTTLEYIKSMNLVCQREYLVCLRLPRLEKLIWSEVSSSPSLPDNAAPSTDPNWSLSFPSLLEFEARTPGEVFKLMLKELPNVQTVVLEPITAKKSQSTWALDLIQSLAADEEVLCPRLRRLTLGGSGYRVKANKTLVKPLIKRIIKSRQELGTPIDHFEIAWTKRSGMNEETTQYAPRSVLLKAPRH